MNTKMNALVPCGPCTYMISCVLYTIYYVRWPRRTILLRTNELLRRTDVPAAASVIFYSNWFHGGAAAGTSVRRSSSFVRRSRYIRAPQQLVRAPQQVHPCAAAARSCAAELSFWATVIMSYKPSHSNP